MVTNVNKKETFLNVRVNVSVHHINADVRQVQKAWDPLKLELQAVMSRTATVNTNTTLRKNSVQCPGTTGELCHTEVLAQTCG